MREIGSEFHFPQRTEAQGSTLRLLDGGAGLALTFSGRGAIGLALDDMGDCKRAMLPDYCCASMIAPFRARGIAVSLYPVNGRGEAVLPAAGDFDVILICRYFGYTQPIDEGVLDGLRARGVRVIEDVTHSLLSDTPCLGQSDYLVASLRKWAGLLSGGFCAKRKGALSVRPAGECDGEFLRLRRLAMEQKSAYLAGGDAAEKEGYLALFAAAERRFAAQEGILPIDPLSRELLAEWDIAAMRAARRQNAALLHEGLKDTPYVPLFELREGDCPLFVPITAPSGAARDDLRRRLIDAHIYCPIHWPRPSEKHCSDLYEAELSLVCDSRYTVADMQRILTVIKE